MPRGQASIEYMFILGLSLVIAGVLWTVSSTNIEDSRWELNIAYSESALQKLLRSADEIYVQGPPAQKTINIDLPDNVNAVYIQGNAVFIEMWWKGILRNASDVSITNMTGYINPAAGRHRVIIRAGNPVSIAEA